MASLLRMRCAAASVSRVTPVPCRAVTSCFSSAAAEKKSDNATKAKSEEKNNYFVPLFIAGTLGLGFYLHKNDYMHRRESDGVLAATPEPLKGLPEAVRRNVPGAYEQTK